MGPSTDHGGCVLQENRIRFRELCLYTESILRGETSESSFVYVSSMVASGSLAGSTNEILEHLHECSRSYLLGVSLTQMRSAHECGKRRIEERAISKRFASGSQSDSKAQTASEAEGKTDKSQTHKSKEHAPEGASETRILSLEELFEFWTVWKLRIKKIQVVLSLFSNDTSLLLKRTNKLLKDAFRGTLLSTKVAKEIVKQAYQLLHDQRSEKLTGLRSLVLENRLAKRFTPKSFINFVREAYDSKYLNALQLNNEKLLIRTILPSKQTHKIIRKASQTLISSTKVELGLFMQYFSSAAHFKTAAYYYKLANKHELLERGYTVYLINSAYKLLLNSPGDSTAVKNLTLDYFIERYCDTLQELRSVTKNKKYELIHAEVFSALLNSSEALCKKFSFDLYTLQVSRIAEKTQENSESSVELVSKEQSTDCELVETKQEERQTKDDVRRKREARVRRLKRNLTRFKTEFANNCFVLLGLCRDQSQYERFIFELFCSTLLFDSNSRAVLEAFIADLSLYSTHRITVFCKRTLSEYYSNDQRTTPVLKRQRCNIRIVPQSLFDHTPLQIKSSIDNELGVVYQNYKHEHTTRIIKTDSELSTCSCELRTRGGTTTLVLSLVQQTLLNRIITSKNTTLRTLRTTFGVSEELIMRHLEPLFQLKLLVRRGEFVVCNKAFTHSGVLNLVVRDTLSIEKDFDEERPAQIRSIYISLYSIVWRTKYLMLGSMLPGFTVEETTKAIKELVEENLLTVSNGRAALSGETAAQSYKEQISYV